MRSKRGHQQRADQHRRRQHHQDRRGEHRPHEDRQARPGHPGRAVGDDRGDHVQAEQRHRDADEREEADVGVHPHHGLFVERLIAGPAGGKAAEEDRRGEDEAGRHQQPEGERLDPREGHAPRPDHDRHEVVAERAEDARGHHSHHHRAVHPHQREVLVGSDRRRRRVEQLDADQHRVEPGDEEEHADPDQVLDADDLVVGAQAEVATHALVLLLAQATRAGRACARRVVGEAEADQEADHAEEIAEHQGDVVLVGGRLEFEAGAFDLVADEPAEVVAGDTEDHRGKQVEADQATPQRAAAGTGENAGPRREAALIRLSSSGSGMYLVAYLGRYFCTGAKLPPLFFDPGH